MPDGVLLDLHGKPMRRYDQFAAPHATLFSAIMASASHTYLHEKWDEALKHQRENALSMRRDGWLQSILRERIDCTLGLKWHLEPEEQNDQTQTTVAAAVEDAVRRTPRLRRALRHELQALWFGRYGVQVKWDWQDIQSRRTLIVRKHIPVNGDKIGHQFNGVPYVLIHSAADTDQLGVNRADVITTTLNRGLLLRGGWRDRFWIHTHDPDDADFFEPDMAGAVHGVGIRSRIYWLWWLRDEYLSWIIDHMERVGLGIVLIYFEQGNKESETAADDIASNYSRRLVFKVPRPPGTLASRVQGGASGVEVVEAPTAGVEVLQKMREDLEDKIERYIIGQSMSSGSDNESGLGGSGRAAFAADTKYKLVAGDAEDLAETLTGSDSEPGPVNTIFKWTFPEYYGKFRLTWKFDIDEWEPEKKLEAVSKAYSIGVEFVEDEVRELTGLSKPAPGDKTISKAKEAQQGSMGGLGGMPGAGGPPAGPGGPGESPEAMPEGEEEAPEEQLEPGGTEAFMEHLASLQRGEDAVAYWQDGEPVFYAPEDWDRQDISRGPNKGKTVWVHRQTKRRFYGEQAPGTRLKARQEAAATKRTAKEEARKARQPKGTPQDAGKLIEALKAKPDAAQAKQLAELLTSLRLEDLKALNRQYGLKATATKKEMALKMAERALGTGQKAPAKPQKPVQPAKVKPQSVQPVKNKPAQRKKVPSNPLDGHPFAGKNPQQMVQELLRDASTHAPLGNPRGYDTRSFPDGVNGPELEKSVQDGIAEHTSKNAFSRPTVQALYENARKSQPTLTLGQFQSSLVKMLADGKVTLHPYTQALGAADPGSLPFMIPLDREPKFYVGAGKAPQQPAGQQHESAVLDTMRRLNQAAGGHNLIPLVGLRGELAKSGMDRAAQDAAIHGLRKRGILSGAAIEGRHGISAEEQAAGIDEGGGKLLGYLSFRNPADAQGKPAQPQKAPLRG